jgi:hypothetical protein
LESAILRPSQVAICRLRAMAYLLHVVCHGGRIEPGVHSEDPIERPANFLEEQIAEERLEARRLLLRWTIGFGLLFGGVFLAFWWSGSALRFGAGRVTASNAPTYRIWGAVRDAKTGEPIPWAVVEDDPAGNPPFYRADADAEGVYSLLTLAEPHRLRISAVEHRPAVVRVGRAWFLWWPRGEERHDVRLEPE